MKQSAYSDIVSDGGMDPRNIKSAPQAHSMTPLYKKPQWQGLTDDELREMLGYDNGGYIPDHKRNFVKAIEAKLKEKNR